MQSSTATPKKHDLRWSHPRHMSGLGAQTPFKYMGRLSSGTLVSQCHFLQLLIFANKTRAHFRVQHVHMMMAQKPAGHQSIEIKAPCLSRYAILCSQTPCSPLQVQTYTQVVVRRCYIVKSTSFSHQILCKSSPSYGDRKQGYLNDFI